MLLISRRVDYIVLRNNVKLYTICESCIRDFTSLITDISYINVMSDIFISI